MLSVLRMLSRLVFANVRALWDHWGLRLTYGVVCGGVGSGGRQQMFFVATDSKLKSSLSGVDPAIGWRRVSGDKSGVKLNISPPQTL